MESTKTYQETRRISNIKPTTPDPNNNNLSKLDVATSESRDDDDELSLNIFEEDSKASTERFNELPEIIVGSTDSNNGTVEQIDKLFNSISILLKSDSESLDSASTSSSESKGNFPSARPSLSKIDEVQLIINKYTRSKKKNHMLREALGVLGDVEDSTSILDVNILNFKDLISTVDDSFKKEQEESLVSQKVLEQARQLQSILKQYQQLTEENKTLSSSAGDSSIERIKEKITKSHNKLHKSVVEGIKAADSPIETQKSVLQISQTSKSEKPNEGSAFGSTKTLTVDTTGSIIFPIPAAKSSSQKEKYSKEKFLFPDSDGSSLAITGTPSSTANVPIKSPKVLMALEGLHKAKIINDKFDKENKELKKRLMLLESIESNWKSQLELKEQINCELSIQLRQMNESWEAQQISHKQETAKLLEKIEEQSSIISKLTDQTKLLMSDNEILNNNVVLLRNSLKEGKGTLADQTEDLHGLQVSHEPDSKLHPVTRELESFNEQDKEEEEELRGKKEANKDALAQNAQYEKDVKEYQLRVKILEGTITTLNNRLIEMKMDSELRDRDEKEKQELEQRVSLHHQELSQLQAENFELQNRCKQAEDKIVLLEKNLSTAEGHCSRYSEELRASQNRTKTLGSAISDFENRMLELQSENSDLLQQVNTLVQTVSSSKDALEASQNQVSALECTVSDLKRREIEQDSLCKEMGEENFQLCREMEKLTLKVSKTLQSYAESRNEIKSLQNAINIISNKHESHVEEIESAATVLREERNIATAQVDEISNQLNFKRQQLNECQNGLAMLLKELSSKKKLMKDLKETVIIGMKEEDAEFRTIGMEICGRIRESFGIINRDMDQLRTELKTGKENMDNLKIEFKNKLSEKEAEFMMRENSIRIRLNDIIDSKNRQIHTLEEDVERILSLASVTEQNEQYLKQELVNAEENLSKLKLLLATDEGRKETMHKAWLNFEEQLYLAKKRVYQLADVFGIHVEGKEVNESQAAVAPSRAYDDMLQAVESSTSLMSDLVLKLELAYPQSERLNQLVKQLTDEKASLNDIIQSMNASFEKASDKVEDKQQLVDSLEEENKDLKQRLATLLAQEEHAGLLFSQKLNEINEEKSLLETSNAERMKEVERLEEDIATERTVTSKLKLENEELIKSRNEAESHYRKMLEDAIASSSELQEKVEMLQKENEFWASANTLSERERAENSDLKGLLKEAYSRLTEAHTRLDDALSSSHQDRLINKQLLEENDDLKGQIDESSVVIAELRRQLDDLLRKNEEIQSNFDKAVAKFEDERLQEMEKTKRTIDELGAEIARLKCLLEDNSANNYTIQNSFKEFNSREILRENKASPTEEELLKVSAENDKLKEDLKKACFKVNELESLLMDIKKEKSSERLQRSLSKATARIASLEEDARKSKEISDASLSALRLENLELSEELRDAEIRINHLERISETSDIVKQLTKEIKMLKSKYRQAQEALKNQAKRLDSNNEGGHQSTEKTKQMEKMLNESYATIERQRSEAKTLQTRLKSLEHELGLLKAQKTAGRSNGIKILEQERDQLKKKLATQEQDLTTVVGDLKKCKLRNHQYRDQISTLKEQLFDAEKAKERLTDQENRIKGLQRDKEEMELQLQSLRRQLKDHQLRKKALEKELTENTNLLLAVKEKFQAQNRKGSQVISP